MDTVKRLILLQVPTSICNFRCHYCYLAQRDDAFQGNQAEMRYSPLQVATALSTSRLGGPCFINVCAVGETLLTKDIDLYLIELVKAGHYLEIVTNLTITPVLERILSWDSVLLKHVEFKCSFHFLELKKKGLLDTFANNVHKVWAAGASATIEVTPSDELIPYIDVLKEFSMREFGALPQLTIARDDRTKKISRLTNLSPQDYEKTWSVFHSNFWEFKQSVFGVKQKEFCYAGCWSITVSLADGNARRCYYEWVGNIFDNPNAPLPLDPIGKCPIAHCFNAHAFLTFGLIPHKTDVRYGDIRNRIRTDGSEWLQPELKAFFNGYLPEANREWSKSEKRHFLQGKKKTNLRVFLSKHKLYQQFHNLKERLK